MVDAYFCLAAEENAVFVPAALFLVVQIVLLTAPVEQHRKPHAVQHGGDRHADGAQHQYDR